jgi:hypothetical protein
LTPDSPDGSGATWPRSVRGAFRRENTLPFLMPSVVAGPTVSYVSASPAAGAAGVPHSTHTGSVASARTGLRRPHADRALRADRHLGDAGRRPR